MIILYLYTPHIHLYIFLHLLDNTPISMPFILDIRNNLCRTNSGSNSGHISSCTALTDWQEGHTNILLQTKLDKDYCCVPMTYTASVLEFRSVVSVSNNWMGLACSDPVWSLVHVHPWCAFCLDILSLRLIMHVSFCTNMLFVVYCLCSDVLVHLPKGRWACVRLT